MRKHTIFLLGLFLLSGLCPAVSARAAEAPGATADEAGVSAGYFPVLPYGAGPDAQPQLVPVASNHPLGGDHAGITRAVIVIHDVSRNAGATMAMIEELAGADNDTTMILAPQFLQENDINRYGGQLPDHGRMFARWPLDGWENGGDSLVSQAQPKGISSYTVTDLLLMYLGAKSFFPDLKQIVIAGHGAGGDFVQRYAALGQAPDILDRQQLPVRFVVADASSFLYFTAQRPQGVNHGFVSPDAKACPIYNSYPYGLGNLNGYGLRVGVNAITLRYVTRRVIYLTGANAAKTDPLPDNGCAAMLEGTDRVLRAENYDRYLTIDFGDAAHKRQSFVTIPGAAFEPAAIFGSRCGMSALFGDGDCMLEPVSGAGIPQ